MYPFLSEHLNSHWVVVLLSLVSLSVLSTDTLADALLAVAPSNDSAAA